MKIRLIVSRCGPAGAQNAGDEIEVSDAEAQRMFAAQPPQAVPVAEAGVERAVVPAAPERRKRQGRR